MSKELKLRVFISYNHLDDHYAKEFIKHIAPLKSKQLPAVSR